MIKSLTSLILLGSALAVLIAGCGGNGGGNNGTADITKAQLIKQGDAICHKADEAQTANLGEFLERHPKPLTTQTGKEELVETVGLPPIQVETEELAALSAPSGEEDKVQAIIVAMEEGLASAEENPLSMAAGADANPFTDVNKLAREYGFNQCSEVL